MSDSLPIPEVSPESDALAAWLNRLPGGPVVWIIVSVELFTFALFFLGFAWSYTDELEVFSTSQALLHPTSGAINTAVLLTGSWLIARGAQRALVGRDAVPWLIATAVSGVVFTGIKISEYVDVFSHGVSLSTNQFWFFYLFLTVLHLVHVVIGIGICAVVAYGLRRPGENPPDVHTVESAATYWHLVDLIWILLFPLLYMSGAQ